MQEISKDNTNIEISKEEVEEIKGENETEKKNVVKGKYIVNRDMWKQFIARKMKL